MLAQQIVTSLMLGSIYVLAAASFIPTIGVLNFSISGIFILGGTVTWAMLGSGTLEHITRSASHTRLLRFAPGVYTTSPLVHDHWEEVLLPEGNLAVGNGGEGMGGARFNAKTYACRPPGVSHGPFKSEGECVLFEIHYHDKGNA